MNTYRITFKVRPTPMHPNYYGLEFGFLTLILFDQSQEEVQRRALAIFSQLHYELVGDRFVISDITKTTGEEFMASGAPWVTDCVIQALKFGFFHYLLAFEVGADEPTFLKSLFPEEWKAPEA